MEKLEPAQKKRRIALVVAGLCLLMAAALLLIRNSYYAALPTLTETTSFEVAPGSSLSRIALDLERQGILENTRLLTLVARISGVAGSIRAGEYEFDPGSSSADILNTLVSGETVQHRVTFVEGWTLQQALAALAELDTITHTLVDTSSEELAAALRLEVSNPEGMIHPDTYFFDRGASDIDILRRARNRQQQVLDNAWANKLGALPLETPYQALVLASVIEKESGVSSERGHIAGVFIRRLERNMRLQSDPTVIYGLGADFDGNLTRAHLETTTPYNTYRINGLPPTPIALAGEDSIIASLNPSPSEYLYFVATGDGGHKFSATLEEHNAAVDLYQRGVQGN